jgi:hypothetical protein
MNTRDFLLIGAGAVVGYLLVGVIKNNKPVAGDDTTSLPNTSSQTLPPDTVGGSNSSNQTQSQTGQETLVDPRLTLCEENWTSFSQTVHFGSEQQLNATKSNFITNCLARIQ